jgi:hypothetical protein
MSSLATREDSANSINGFVLLKDQSGNAGEIENLKVEGFKKQELIEGW